MRSILYPGLMQNILEHSDTINMHVNCFNTLRTFSNAFSWMEMSILIKISLTFVPKCPIKDIPALLQIMACCWRSNKRLTEPMMVSLLMHIYASLGLNELKWDIQQLSQLSNKLKHKGHWLMWVTKYFRVVWGTFICYIILLCHFENFWCNH